MGILAALASWSGRVLAIGLFEFWGAFFVEHLGWFVHPGQGVPPVRVWLLHWSISSCCPACSCSSAGRFRAAS
jgi:hypothetical protein